ncbi:MAG TPA: hypothetical protein VLA35_07815, partial [Thermoleophilia bacterium]|nr:hypothetical protein [Thermoleophilia bacterium]
MGPASAVRRPSRRLFLLLGALLSVAALGALMAAGAWPSGAAEAAGDAFVQDAPVVLESVEASLPLVITPTWAQTGAWGGNHDGVATAPRTVYVTGLRSGDSSIDLSLTKYVDGALRWERLYDGPAQRTDQGCAIAARGTAIYTAGVRQSLRGDLDLVLVRWDSAGDRLWTRAYDSGARLDEWAHGVAVDGDGNVTVVGSSGTPTSDDDWVIISYKADGTQRYVRRYDSPAHLADSPAKMLVDSAGNVYVAGTSESATNGMDAFLVKYSKAGDRLWTRRYNGTANAYDTATSLRARPGGGVYVAGRTESVATGYDGLLLAYTAAGTRLFVVAEAGSDISAESGQIFRDLEVLPGGDIICGGSTSLETVDRFWAVYSPTGELRDRTVDDTGDGITHMAKDGQGGVLLTGTASDSTGVQVLTERISIGGTNWRCIWPESPASDYEPMAVFTNGVNAYIVGDSVQSFVLGHVY